MSTRFHANPEFVLADDLDGEIVLLHLASGNYYSLAGTAAAVWRCVTGGWTLEGTIEALSRRYSGAEDEIRSSVEAFSSELVAEELLEQGPGENTASGDTESGDTESENAASKDPNGADTDDIVDDSLAATFEAPALNKYTDMQDLLLLDPIHEVDAAGWPATPDQAGED